MFSETTVVVVRQSGPVKLPGVSRTPLSTRNRKGKWWQETERLGGSYLLRSPRLSPAEPDCAKPAEQVLLRRGYAVAPR